MFDTAKFAGYAKFANLKLNKMKMGSRVKVDKEKKQPWDFLLWVTNQPDHKMLWDSPWGKVSWVAFGVYGYVNQILG